MKRTQKIILTVTSICTVIILGISILLVTQAGTNQKLETTSQTTQYSINSSKPVKSKQPTKQLAQVKQLVTGYRYDEAIALLEKNDTNEAQQLLTTLKKEKEALIKWEDPTKISHVFFHSLIVEPMKAFHTQQAQGYKDYMVTISEFNKTIDQLYKNNYVLVNLNELIKTEPDGKLTFIGVSLPEGKKPLILSQDDVSYYEYMENSGFSSKLIVDKQNQIKNIYINNKKETVGDYDVVPLINSFIKKHPDFSYKGAKGTLALTGYNGILGYRTSKSEYGDNEKTNKEIAAAKKVTDQLKKDGWSFASHTWGHLNMTQASLEDIQQDNERWQKEVAPILGKTTIFIYPFGADINDWQPYSEANQKFAYLKQQGFDIFCNVDATTPAWGQLGTDYYRNARINIDGIRFKADLNGENPILDQFINVKEVYDQKDRG